ncbi:hypothetical protein GW17_00011677 [Ensete ventricosum]|nr:hypothetical protein GW17_00011677 [Ensete ventricosum]
MSRRRDLSSVLLDTTTHPSAVIRLAARYKKIPSSSPKKKTLLRGFARALLRIVTRWVFFASLWLYNVAGLMHAELLCLVTLRRWWSVGTAKLCSVSQPAAEPGLLRGAPSGGRPTDACLLPPPELVAITQRGYMSSLSRMLCY